MFVVRKKLSPDEISPSTLRYNPDCDCIQQTPDNGTTWVDVPAADPRTAPGFALPTPGAGSMPCDASARIVGAWEDTLTLLYSTINAAAFASGVLAILLTLAGGVGILLDLIFGVLEVLISIGVADIQAAFTPEQWHTIQCIIDCHIEPDGSVTADDAAAILSDIAASQPTIVYNVLVELINLFGNVLMNNAGVERSETGDCSDCDCAWCYTFDFTADDGGFSAPFGLGEYTPGVGWTNTYGFFTNGYNGVLIQRVVDMTLTALEIEFTYIQGTPPIENLVVIANSGFASPNLIVVPYTDPPPTSPLSWTDTATALSGIAIDVLDGETPGANVDPGGSAAITRLTLHGTGTNPFGTDNC